MMEKKQDEIGAAHQKIQAISGSEGAKVFEEVWLTNAFCCKDLERHRVESDWKAAWEIPMTEGTGPAR